MRQPKELTEGELATIAFKVRRRLTEKFGSERASIALGRDRDVISELLRATYVAVREQIEDEAR